MEIKGYKAFNSDWTCRSKQYTCPGEFEENVDLELCKSGMHFCEKLGDCFTYYKFSPETKVAEVIAYGNVKRDNDEDPKICTDKLRIVRELSWAEVFELVNTGQWNTGYDNTGDYNAGNYNAGNYNTGDENIGNCNAGNHNTGNCNIGHYNAGNGNAGRGNTGNGNTGHCNAGGYNTGDLNSGDCNGGGYNTGDWNTGNYNSGNYNTGHWNSGNYNTGHWNSGNYNTGVFCSDNEKRIKMFNKPSQWTFEDFSKSKVYKIMSSFRPVLWIYANDMTEEEKEAYPESKTTGGYLKKNDIQKWWNDLSPEDRKEVMSLPNFDTEVFRKCTGINVEK